MMMKKGLFGKSMMPGAMQPAYSMPQNQTMQDGANLGTPAPQQQRQPGFWQGGGKFTGRDALAAALAVIGDGFSGGRGAVGGLMEGRMAPQREAARLAEEQRKRAADLADYRSQMQIKQEFAGPAEMDAFDTAMARAGIAKGSPKYNEYAQEAAQRTGRGADPFLQGAPLPGGGSFTGSFADYQAMVSGGQPPPSGSRRPAGKLTPIGGGGVSNGPGSF